MDAPQVGAIYRGRVSGVMDFGCFVELLGFRGKTEGLVHASAVSKARVPSVKEAVRRGQDVWVKVVSATGSRLSLSMRDVDQATGRDLAPALPPPADFANPAAPGTADPSKSALHGLSGIRVSDDLDAAARGRRPGKRLSSPERWELTQLVKAGVIDITEHPDYDEESGGLVVADDDVEEEFEVDLNDAEPEFLKGQSGRGGVEVSPIKIVKNPDGSMQRAAMTQSALAKERRELREQTRRDADAAVPRDLSRPWEDPLPEAGERHLAAELRGAGQAAFEVPEWKAKALGKAPTYGVRDTRSMKEQRESLPIFKLRDQLIEAVEGNQVSGRRRRRRESAVGEQTGASA